MAAESACALCDFEKKPDHPCVKKLKDVLAASRASLLIKAQMTIEYVKCEIGVVVSMKTAALHLTNECAPKKQPEHVCAFCDGKVDNYAELVKTWESKGLTRADALLGICERSEQPLGKVTEHFDLHHPVRLRTVEKHMLIADKLSNKLNAAAEK